MSSVPLAAGFTDPARDSQRAFRALMKALAEPGRVERLETGLKPPAPLTPELAALALTLLDFETTVWLDGPLASVPAVAEFLRFHTSARLVAAPNEAQFALISDAAGMPDFSVFAVGEPDFPDRSTTLLVSVTGFVPGPLLLSGPGLKAPCPFGAEPLADDFAERMAANRTLFPLGIDVVLAAPGAIAGLPRSVIVSKTALPTREPEEP